MHPDSCVTSNKEEEEIHPQKKELIDTLQSAVEKNEPNAYVEVLDKIDELAIKDITVHDRVYRLVLWLRSKA